MFKQKNTLVTRRVSRLGHNEDLSILASLYLVYYMLTVMDTYFKAPEIICK